MPVSEASHVSRTSHRGDEVEEMVVGGIQEKKTDLVKKVLDSRERFNKICLPFFVPFF